MRFDVESPRIVRMGADDNRGSRGAAGAQFKQRDRTKRLRWKPKRHQIGPQQMAVLPLNLLCLGGRVTMRKSRTARIQHHELAARQKTDKLLLPVLRVGDSARKKQ